MLSNRLGRFFIMSSVLHMVAFSVTYAVFKPEAIVTEPQPIRVGVITEYKDPGVGSGNSVQVPPGDLLKRGKQIVKQKETPKTKKKVVKNTVKKKPKKISEKREIISRNDKPETEQLAVASAGSNEAGETIELPSYVGAGIRVSKDGKGAGTEGSGKGVEVGYPDYKLNPKPEYPMIARRNGYEGLALLRVLVLESGKVGKVELEKSSGYGILDKSAIEAVEGWIFVPGKRDGIPVSSWVTVPIRFQLSSG
jgi:protein TonB